MMFTVKQDEMEKSYSGNMRCNRGLEMFSSDLPFTSTCFSGFPPSMHQRTNTHYLDSSFVKNPNEYMLDELGLCENLGKMNFGAVHDDYSRVRGLGTDSNWSSDDYMAFKAFRSNVLGNYVISNDDRQTNLLGGFCSEPHCYIDGIGNVMKGGSYNGGLQLNTPSMNRPYLNDKLCWSHQSGFDFVGDTSPLNLSNSYQSVCGDGSVLKEQIRAVPKDSALTDTWDLEAFGCEDSFTIQGKALKYIADKGFDPAKCRKKTSHNKMSLKNQRETSISPMVLQRGPLDQFRGYIYYIVKDQLGCRFLQKIFDEGTDQDVQIIYNELLNHVVELMMNPFGNYLVQKLLEVCCEEQITHIVFMVTEKPGELVRICLNMHGTRVVQKLIETLKTRQQKSMVVSALEQGFLDLVKDLNGNHAIKSCLQCLSKEDNKFIFVAAAKFCFDMATHQHGCCILNSCIAQSVGKYREKLVKEIAAHGLLLAQDAFGNYVVQNIIELKIPSVAAILSSQFKGHYVSLAMQKFSSHVVQKCLNYFEESRPIIIQEFILVPHFEQLLQDPFANYVIKSALEVSKGTLHALLVQAVQRHSTLRNSPYCKRIFSSDLLKK